jgi:hypothetical protein
LSAWRSHACDRVHHSDANHVSATVMYAVGAAPVSMPPDDMKMTREGAERLSTGSSSRVRWKAPSVLVAKLSSRPSAEVDLASLDCVEAQPAIGASELGQRCRSQRCSAARGQHCSCRQAHQHAGIVDQHVQGLAAACVLCCKGSHALQAGNVTQAQVHVPIACSASVKGGCSANSDTILICRPEASPAMHVGPAHA